ncbi:hypothetical protein A1O3_06615 [Capronia epimyces CBS 606.96]|uniref:SMP-30/Gluconolactonase/LRE-like region domain-containing protein n=1 Tax=Capronia epimyces CBS 606.96 TaxID=1182542 RepID=W9XZI6_9EURO|nr:uncharacterized protein A1O3_06615 [Capronia epimyces CBS 606.96]EXJ82800.1 hypothetical protein A1O3_06615 [Capronia epimyces CBS 606.96]
MPSKLTAVSALLAAAALLYQFFLKDFLFATLGLGRTVLSVSEFPYSCHRIHGDPNIQACEDMWLDEKSRTLFLACSDPVARKHWMPNIHRLNASGRALHDHVVALNIDNPSSEGGFTYRVLQTPGFSGVHGDGRIHVVGLTGSSSASTSADANGLEIQLWLINARPSVDPLTGELLDNTVVGGNSTIELFTTEPDTDSMKHIKTFADPHIATPNNVALAEGGGFFFTNDHGLHKAGWQHHLSTILATGDVSYCSASGDCKQVASGFKFPNGLLLGSDGLLYVPSAAVGGITVFQPGLNGSVKKVHHIDLNYPIDNLSEDANGDIFAAAMPKVLQGMAAFNDPLNAPTAPATVWRVRRLNRDVTDKYDYELVKVIEDGAGEVLPSMTTVIHDALTGRLFMSSEFHVEVPNQCEWL